MRRLLLVALVVAFILPASAINAQGGSDPSAPPEDVDLPINELVYEADFTDEEAWITIQDSNLDIGLVDDGYRITNIDPEEGLGLFTAFTDIYIDFYTELEFTITSCNSDESAFLFDVRNIEFTDGYVFVIQCNGNYRSRALVGGEAGAVDSRGSIDGIEEGSSHTMGVLVEGNAITWYLDGELLTEVEIEELPEAGQLAIGAQLGMDYTMTSWRIWDLVGGEEFDDSASTDDTSADTPVPSGEFGTTYANPDESPLTLTGLLYAADFTDDATWISLRDQNLDVSAVEEGYRIANIEPDSGLGLLNPIDIPFENFYAELEFTINACASENSALLFDVRNVGFDNGYVFVLQCDGEYRSRAFIDGNVGDVDVSGSVDGVDSSSKHVMGVLMDGPTVTWFLNNQEIGTYEVQDAPSEGSFVFGAQLGIDYTMNNFTVWAIDGPVDSADTDTDSATSDDPLTNREFTEVLYNPEFEPPTSIDYGYHYPVARYANPNGIGLFNTQPTAILPFPQVDQENYYFEYNFVIRSCVDDAFIGLVFRAGLELEDFYAYGIECNGDYRARAVIDGEAGDVISEGNIGNALPEEGILSISVFVRGETAWLYFGQELIDTIEVTELEAGLSGILLQSSSDGIPVDILVTDLAIGGVSE